MQFLKLQMLLLSNLHMACSFSQVPRTDVSGQITNLSEAKSQRIIDEVRFYEPEGNRRLPYSRIGGSPFWKDKFLPAKIFTTAGQIYYAPIRLNLVTNEIHFLRNGEEMVLVEMSIDKIVFYLEKDSILFLANILSQFMNTKKENSYLEILNPGNYQLLKYTKRTVSSADSLFRTQKRYFFTDETSYFLRHNERTEKLKKLAKDNIFKLLPSALPYSQWVDDNKIDLKKEEDVIRFLNHYNTTHR